jgi:SAV_6107-like HEPN
LPTEKREAFEEATMTITTTARVPAQRTPQRAPQGAPQRAGPAFARSGPRPVAAPTSRAALGLLRQAADGLTEAHRAEDPLLRYPAAYLAALRAGAAVLAVRARPQPRRGSTRNVWELLAEVAPEFAEWAAFFSSCSATRAAAEAGIARLVGRREADDLLRQAEQFVGLVTASVPVR